MTFRQELNSNIYPFVRAPSLKHPFVRTRTRSLPHTPPGSDRRTNGADRFHLGGPRHLIPTLFGLTPAFGAGVWVALGYFAWRAFK